MRSCKRLTIALLAAISAAASPLTAQRQRFSFDPGWRFMLGDPAGAERPEFNTAQWRTLDLPHDWSIEGTPDQTAPGGGRVGFLPTGIGWYRKSFRLPSSSRGRAVWLEFDGIYMNSDVWLNGNHLGRRPFGYVSFAYDITRHLVPGINSVAVRVENSKQPNSRWYSGSGIYRHAWITIADPLHIAHWGTTVTTPQVDSASASVTVRTRIENEHRSLRRGVLRSSIIDPNGREVARAELPFSLNAGQDSSVEQKLAVPAPQLWSVDSPKMYSVHSVVTDGPRRVDDVKTPFGIRSIAYDKDKGFLLNGQRVKMKGVNLHHDAGAVGAAVPERVWQRRLELLKAMGANAIRTAHNPPAPEFLDLADRIGFLVMDEAFDEWKIGKVEEGYNKYFDQWSERDLTDIVRRDRNHPSVVLWSAGNEIREQPAPGGHFVLRRLMEILQREDPTRPVTTGNDEIYADGHPATVEFLSAADIVGYNYVDRWHGRRETFAETDRHDHPEWKLIGTESTPVYGAFSGSYSLGDSSTVVRPNYTTGMIRAQRQWKWVATRDYFAGDFMWTGIDYLGESRWPSKGAPSGPINVAGHPKEAFYFYQSQWTDTPVLHVFPHWNWPGREGQVIPVLAYTNCTAVELFLNGRSFGEKRLEFPAQGAAGGWNTYAKPQVFPTTADLHLSWDVPYEPGVLKAVGKRDGKVACEAEVRTTGAPAAIRLTADRETIDADPRDVAHVTFEVVDADGNVVPTANNTVQFTISGGSITALDNANLTDHEPYRADHRRAFNGRGLAILRAMQPGAMRLTASADGLKSAEITIRVRKGNPLATLHGEATP